MKFGGNMKNLMKQATKMKEQMAKVQEEVGEREVEATSGGGMVTVTAKAKGEITSIKIEPDVVNENDQEMLQDLIVAAVNEALKAGPETYERRSIQTCRRAWPASRPTLIMSRSGLPKPVSRLIDELSKLPGIGEKNATRLAFHI